VDVEGFARVVIEGDVPRELQAKAALAVANCPEGAISVEET
jgi:ferredoxin